MVKGESKFVGIALLALLAIGSSAPILLAQRASTPRTANNSALGEQDVKQLLLLMDTDKNGKISRQEYVRFMQAEFDRMDVDKNGELDTNELKTYKLRPTESSGENYAAALVLLMDADKNGKVSRQEYMNFIQAEFERLDEDKNGELDVKELRESRLRPVTFTATGK